MRLEVRLAALVGVVTGGFVLADLALSRHSNISLDPKSYIEFAKVMAMLAICFSMMLLIDRRLASDESRIALFIRSASDGVKSLAWNAALFIPLGFASIYFMYLAAATDKPLMDEALAVVDAHLGFNWRAFLEITNAHPMVADVLVLAYHALAPQLPLVFLFLAFADRLRLTEIMAMLAVSSALTAVGMASVAAAGAYAYFSPGPEDFSNFTARAGVWHLAELTKIRSGTPISLLVTHAEGLVTFPSYHTALGIMVTYAVRKFRWIFWPLAVLNATMIISTLPEGGHHLVDVIAGAGIGMLSIAAVWLAQTAFRPLRIEQLGRSIRPT